MIQILDTSVVFHFDPPLFSHAKAEAPPTGFADRGFDSPGTFSLPFSPDTVLFT
jgi:hypothetical protein